MLRPYILPANRFRTQKGTIPYLVMAMVAALIGITTVLARSDGITTDYFSTFSSNDVYKQAGMIRQAVLECSNVYASWPTTSGNPVSTLLCPGAPTSYQPLWGSQDGRFLPAPPKGWTAWNYADDGSTTSITTTTPATTSAQTAIQLLFSTDSRQRFTSSEGKCIVSGGTLTFTLYIRYPSASPPSNSFYPYCGAS